MGSPLTTLPSSSNVTLGAGIFPKIFSRSADVASSNSGVGPGGSCTGGGVSIDLHYGYDGRKITPKIFDDVGIPVSGLSGAVGLVWALGPYGMVDGTQR
jgi:hypothetical protein